jgi:hypothetical protein
MRTLVVIPTIHPQDAEASLTGEQGSSGEEVWNRIRRLIGELELPYANVRLYQDALPLCEKASDVVKDIAARGSKNHQFLVELMQQGAQLVGTEDPHLLLQEYQVLRAKLGGGEQGSENEAEGQSRQRLSERDRFIAERINATLARGEIGLLFLDPAHSVVPHLNADIVVKTLLPAPGDGRAMAEPVADQRRPGTFAHLHQA